MISSSARQRVAVDLGNYRRQRRCTFVMVEHRVRGVNTLCFILTFFFFLCCFLRTGTLLSLR